MSLLQSFKNKSVYMVSDCDLDGIGCTILAEYFIRPLTKRFVRYNTAERGLPEFDWREAALADIVIVSDITPPSLEFYNKIKEKSEVYIFDHHITGRQELGELENYFFDTERCGTRILFDEVMKGERFSKKVFQFVELIDTYDRYLTNSSLWRNAKALHNLLYASVDWKRAKYQTDTVKYNTFVENQIKKFENNAIKSFYFTNFEVANALKAEQKEKKNYDEAKRNLKIRTDDSGNTFGYTECTSKVSWVSSLLLKEYSNLDYLIARGTWDKNSFKVSLRSNGAFKVNTIAEKWGGGGHPQASGLDLKDPQMLEDVRSGKLNLI